MIQPAALVCLSTLLAHVCLCRARPTLGCAPWMPLVFALSTLTLLATTIFLAISGFNAHTLPSSLPALSQPLPTFLSLSSPASFIFVGILSHPANHARRAAYRASCIPALDAARVPYKFFVGRPSQDTGVISKSQGRHGTPAEIAEARALLNETRAFGDVEIGTAREHYRDLTDKTIRLYRYGLAFGSRYIVKIDDDQCLLSEKVRKDLKRLEKKVKRAEVYGGTHQWNGREYDSMVGPHNHSAPYMGSLSFLSRKLAYEIFVEDKDVTFSWIINGTSSEDANMGQWVQAAQRRHPEMKVKFLKNASYVRRFDLAGTKTR